MSAFFGESQRPSALQRCLLARNGFLKFAVFVVAEANGAGSLGDFYNRKRRLANWARIRQRLIPEDEIAIRVVGAAIENLAAAGFSFHYLSRTTVAAAANACRIELDVFAVWIIAAGCIFTIPAVLYGELFTALWALFFEKYIVLDRKILG